MTSSDPSTATVRRVVEWPDTDASGHQHNSLIMRLFEDAERALLDAAGLAGTYFPTAPRVRQEIDFTGKLYFRQPVTTTITLERVGRTSLTWHFEVWGEAFGDVPRRRAASGRVICAHVPAGTDRSAPWPDAVRAALTPREDAG